MTALRMLYLSVAAVVLTGIGLTGFDRVHWFLYVPVVFLGFAGLTGVCPGLLLWERLGFAGGSCPIDRGEGKPPA